MEVRVNKKPPTMKDIMWQHYEATLRDDLAKAALSGLLQVYTDVSFEGIAQSAYEIADEMLKARGLNKEGEGDTNG